MGMQKYKCRRISDSSSQFSEIESDLRRNCLESNSNQVVWVRKSKIESVLGSKINSPHSSVTRDHEPMLLGMDSAVFGDFPFVRNKIQLDLSQSALGAKIGQEAFWGLSTASKGYPGMSKFRESVTDSESTNFRSVSTLHESLQPKCAAAHFAAHFRSSCGKVCTEIHTI